MNVIKYNDSPYNQNLNCSNTNLNFKTNEQGDYYEER